MLNNPETALPGQQLIEEIIYMASLATQVAALDPLLAPMRAITARQDPNQEMSPADLATLDLVKRNVEHYIVEKESIRLLTVESLRRRVQNKLSGHNPLKVLRLRLVLLLIISAVVAVIPAFLPSMSSDLKQQLGPSLFFTSIYLGAAWFFVAALGELQKPVRQSYVLICSGMVIMGVSQLLQPLFLILNFQKSPYASIIVTSCTIPAMVMLYAGVRSYARRLGITSRATSIKRMVLLTSAAVLVTSAAMFIARPEMIVVLTLVVELIITITILAATVLMYHAQKVTTEIYSAAAAKLWQALLTGDFIGLYALIMVTLFGVADRGGIAAFAVAAVLFIANAVLFLRAGYAFAKANIY